MLSDITKTDLEFFSTKEANLGKGSYGEVQLARHKSTGILVAVKKIMRQNRKKADKRAEPRTERDENKYYRNDIRRLDCDKDAKPLDREMWGNSVFLKTPQTAYSMTYQDPSKVLEQ